MKKTILESFFQACFSFLLILVGGSIINYIYNPKVSMAMEPVPGLGESNYFSIDINNYNRRSLNDLDLLVPTEIKLSERTTTNPVEISESSIDMTANSLSKKVTISGIPPNATTKIFFRLNDLSKKDLFRILNVKEKNIQFITSRDLGDPIQKAIKDAVTSSLIYAIIVWGFIFYLNSASEKRTERINQELKANKERLDEANKSIEKFREFQNKYRKFLLTRLTDYQKELDFWRDTIRKILYEKGKSAEAVKEILNIITKSLRTYSTLKEKDELIDAIELSAEILSK